MLQKVQDIEYQNNFLDDVIFRIDFLNEISFESINNSEFVKEIRKHFSIVEKDIVIAKRDINILVKDGQEIVQTINKELVEKNYFTTEKDMKFTISVEYLTLQIKKYDSYSKILSVLSSIIGILYTVEKDINVKRVGLRYINLYNLKGKNIFDFGQYFGTKLASSFTFVKDHIDFIQPTRMLNRIEFIKDDLKMNFQYGMYNSNNPAKIEKKEFVLDYDCFYMGFVDTKASLIEKINECHETIQYMFEKSITEKLRKEMGKNE